MSTRIIVSLFVLAFAFFAALSLAACATSSAPQTQAERGDAQGVRVAVTVNAFTVSPATTQPTPGVGGYTISGAEVVTLTSTNVVNAGTSSAAATSTAGNPNVNNTPNIQPNVPINVTPGSGLGSGIGK
jgi:hypothetical protein